MGTEKNIMDNTTEYTYQKPNKRRSPVTDKWMQEEYPLFIAKLKLRCVSKKQRLVELYEKLPPSYKRKFADAFLNCATTNKTERTYYTAYQYVLETTLGGLDLPWDDFTTKRNELYNLFHGSHSYVGINASEVTEHIKVLYNRRKDEWIARLFRNKQRYEFKGKTRAEAMNACLTALL